MAPASDQGVTAGAAPKPSIHATCIAIGPNGVLIRGPSGAGKSTLALRLMLDPPRILPPATLVADDRVLLEVTQGTLIARAPDALAGVIEVRNLGLRRVPHLFSVKVNLVIDLAAADAERLPAPDTQLQNIEGISVFRIAVPPNADAALLLAAALSTAEADNISSNCALHPLRNF
ncbi:HPr kinase/phosphorylase [Azorhizobium doebereinerae]|uniref:HPr kinase/phosphorylase n=1 Tax=Azorhizobium doebereinerae TaxID=281091 RepID=UPI00040CEBCB|nr:HPr kinase/phosphatase C-terminal domain-containing protein [Azorhizobium doebereinerae]